MRVLLQIGAVLTLLSLIACAAQAPREAPPGERGGAPIEAGSPAASPAPPDKSPADAVIATLERSGGIAGTTETVVVKGDGTVAVGLTTRQVEGGAAAAAELVSQLVATGIYDVEPGQYMPANTCCDRYTYDLTLVKDGKSYGYVTMDGTENVPPALFEAISLVQQYAAAAR